MSLVMHTRFEGMAGSDTNGTHEVTQSFAFQTTKTMSEGG